MLVPGEPARIVGGGKIDRPFAAAHDASLFDREPGRDPLRTWSQTTSNSGLSEAFQTANDTHPPPSAAAELIVPDSADLLRRVNELRNCLGKCLTNFLQQSLTRLRFLSERTLGRELIQRMRDAQQRLDLSSEALRRRVKQFVADSRATFAGRARSLNARDPKREVALCRTKAVELERRIMAQPSRLLDTARRRFEHVEGILRVLGPDATLRRGYSITTDVDGNVIRTVNAVRAKSQVRTRIADGEFDSQDLPL